MGQQSVAQAQKKGTAVVARREEAFEESGGQVYGQYGMTKTMPPSPQQPTWLAQVQEAAMNGDPSALQMVITFWSNQGGQELGGRSEFSCDLAEPKGARKELERRIETLMESKKKQLDLTRVVVDKIDVSTAEKALNAKYNFFSLLEQLDVPTEGGTKEQDKQLRLLVDRWSKGNEDITSSLRNTFDEGGTGEERLAHVVITFVLPMTQRRDVDPEGEMGKHDFSKLYSGSGLKFHSELLILRDMIKRLPMAVRATPTHWIKRIKGMASVETKAYFEEVLQEELEEGKSRVTKELVKTDWNQFSQVMSKALDLQQKSSKKREELQSPYGLAAHTGPPAMGGGRPPAGGREAVTGCDLCDGYKCPHKFDQAKPCDVHSVSVSQARCAEIIDDPSLKAYVDGGRFHNKKNPLNYPQPTESQKVKLQEYDQFRKEKRATMAAKGKGGNGGNAQRGRPLSTNMHGSPPDDKEEAEAEMSTAEQMKAMRIELGLNVHSLDAAVEKQSARYETADSFDDDELDHEEWPKIA
tara:strand:+ start:375 stop:1949 length:1575 start_codon:yes stop_codon:yes gene_type:complete